jgi:ankyrin repeat protein
MKKTMRTDMTTRASNKVNNVNKRTINFKVITIASVCLLTASLSFAHKVDIEKNDDVVTVLSNGTLTKVDQLIKSGIDINLDIVGDGTPLIIAVQNDNKELAQYLLDQGADVNGKSTLDGNPLIVAAKKNNIELLQFLFQQGAQIDAVTEYDETALISASRAGHFQVVKFLVEQGADINLAVKAKTVKGFELRSPLNGAKTTVIRDYLIANGARS